MGTIALTCPHCETEKVGFHTIMSMAQEGGQPFVLTLATCGHCHDPVVMKHRRSSHGGTPHEIPGDFSKAAHLQLEAIWPKRTEPSAPPDTPERPAAAYREAMDALRR